MRRIILLALVALMAASASPVRAVDEVLDCTVNVEFPQFPEVSSTTDALVLTGSTCTPAAESALTVTATDFEYEDDGCHAGTASGTLMIGDSVTPFAYRRAGTEVKIDVIFRGEHYAGLWQIQFTSPNLASEGGRDQLVQACTSSAEFIENARIELTGRLAVS